MQNGQVVPVPIQLFTGGVVFVCACVRGENIGDIKLLWTFFVRPFSGNRSNPIKIEVRDMDGNWEWCEKTKIELNGKITNENGYNVYPIW